MSSSIKFSSDEVRDNVGSSSVKYSSDEHEANDINDSVPRTEEPKTGQPLVGQTTKSVMPFRTATLTNQFTASLDDTYPCRITSVLVVDNLIYVADGGNRKIKMLDKNGKIMYQCSEMHVFDITLIGKQRIACTSTASFFRILDNTGYTLKLVKKVNTSINTWGICCNNGHIYVSCYDPTNTNFLPQIQIYTTSGELTRTIEPIIDGKRVLERPSYLYINQPSGTIYVSDFKVGVIALSLSGKVQFVKQVFNKTETAQGISIDDQGLVYVCGLNTHNVMMISPEGNDASEILENECKGAQAVRIAGNHMYLCCRDTDIVRVFTLS